MSYLYQWSDPFNILINNPNKTTFLNQKIASKIQQISCGQEHFFILTESKQMIGYGANNKGQLGSQQSEFNCLQYGIIPKLSFKISLKQISCGWNHTLILDENGSVYSCGQGTYGALGYGRGTNSQQFKIVRIASSSKKQQYFSQTNTKIVQISAGRDHSLAISQTKVYGWGNSKDHQLGLVKEKIYFQPQELYIFYSYFCYAGNKCSFFATKEGLYAAGSNQGGKLGLGHQKKIKIPKRINFEHKIKRIQDGGYILIQTLNHEFYISGKGSLGQFLYPTKLKQFKQFVSVSLGKDFGIIKNNSSKNISTWNFNNQPHPVDNQFLSSLNLQQCICGPKYIICFANETSHHLMDRQLMVKSTISNQINYKTETNESPYLMKYNSRKRRQSDDLNLCFQSSNVQEKYNDPEKFSSENALNLSKFVNKNLYHSKRSENNDENIKKIKKGSHEYYLQSLEENSGERQKKELDTPIFIRNKQGDLNCTKQINLDEASQEDDSGLPSKLCLSKNQQINYSKYLQGRVQHLEAQNRSKDLQMRQLKNSYVELLQIFESDSTMKKILQAKNPNFIQKNCQRWNIQSIEQKGNRFTQNVDKLKDLLIIQFSKKKSI